MFNFYMMTNAESDVCSSTVRCVESARWYLDSKHINFLWDIAYAFGQNKSKCVYITRFLLDTDIPYLISVDRDMVFEGTQLEKIYQDLQLGYDLISGIYCVRSGMRLTGYIEKDFMLDGSIIEFKYIPWGFTGVSRKLLERMVKELNLPLLGQGEFKHYPFCEQTVSDEMNEITGDDTSFCEKAHKIGVQPQVDTSVQLGHYGDHIYTIQDFIDFQRSQSEH